MRMKLRLLNVSSELLFSVDVGNLPETYGEVLTKRVALCTGYRHASRRAGEPVLKERQHIRQFTIAYYFRKLGIA